MVCSHSAPDVSTLQLSRYGWNAVCSGAPHFPTYVYEFAPLSTKLPLSRLLVLLVPIDKSTSFQSSESPEINTAVPSAAVIVIVPTDGLDSESIPIVNVAWFVTAVFVPSDALKVAVKDCPWSSGSVEGVKVNTLSA